LEAIFRLGTVFMETSIDKLINQTKLYLCVECGKCVASCPFELSPRTIIEDVLLDFDILKRKEIWSCLTCDVCTKACPSDVRFADFIEVVRLLAMSEGIVEYCLFCQRCGQYYLSIPIEERIREILKRKGLSNEFLDLCPRCKRYDCADKVKVTTATGRRKPPCRRSGQDRESFL